MVDRSSVISARYGIMLVVALALVAAMLVAFSTIGTRAGWARADADDIRMRIDASAPTTSIGRGALTKDGYLLEVTDDRNTAIAIWPVVPRDLSSASLVRCDCIPRRSDADIRLIWRRADQPDRIFSAEIHHELGVTETLDLSRNRDWNGPIAGVGIAVRGYIGDYLLIRGLTARPDTPLNQFVGELTDWSAFRSWDGQSINLTLIGNRDRGISPVVVAALLVGVGLLVLKWRRASAELMVAAAVAGTLVAWLALDLRWQMDLLSKYGSTAAQYGRGPIDSRWRLGADGEIYALAAQVKSRVTDANQRVFVFGSDPYLRGRAAYHLLPFSVHYEPASGALPSAQYVRPGDLIFLTWSRDVRFDAGGRQLIWSGGSVNVEPVLASGGNFVLRVIP